MDKLQAKIKNTFTEFGYRNPFEAAQEPWTESQNTMNIWHKPTHEPISNLNSKVWFEEDLPGNGMLMNIINKRKIMSTTHHRINQLSKPKKWYK
jgi:hypothetical protein